jgi:hypothetical protein
MGRLHLVGACHAVPHRTSALSACVGHGAVGQAGDRQSSCRRWAFRLHRGGAALGRLAGGQAEREEEHGRREVRHGISGGLSGELPRNGVAGEEDVAPAPRVKRCGRVTRCNPSTKSAFADAASTPERRARVPAGDFVPWSPRLQSPAPTGAAQSREAARRRWPKGTSGRGKNSYGHLAQELGARPGAVLSAMRRTCLESARLRSPMG